MSPEKLMGFFIPSFAESRVAILDLDQEARNAITLPDYTGVDPKLFSDANFCSRFVEDLHRRHQVDASFGGYLEDRAFLWQGAYLGGSERSVHLGIDFNVAAGCEVITPFEGIVVLCDDDTPEPFGWGPRIAIEVVEVRAGLSERYIYIFAHLAEIKVREGERVEAGNRIAKVGAAPNNGNWFPHLHVQKVRGDVFDSFRGTELRNLDGYGLRSELVELTRDFPDPVSALVRL